MTKDAIIEEANKLSTKDIFELSEQLRELAESRTDPKDELTEEQLAELRRRYKAYKKNPPPPRPLSDLIDRVRSSR